MPALCAAVAIALGAGAAGAAEDGQGVTALVHLHAADPIAGFVPRPFTFVPMEAHYDGVYFYAIARDPLARGPWHKLIDLASYRYGHPGYGWLTWVASGGGQADAVPWALLVVSLLGLGAAAFAASVLARDLGLSPWWGLSIGFNPGLLFAVTVDTSETVGIALALLAILAWARKRWLWAGIAIGIGCFTKEPLLLVPAALAAWEGLVFVSSRTHPPDLLRRVAAIAIGPVFYALWVWYCRDVFGVLPSSQINQLSFPLAGWIDTFHRAAGLTQSADAQIGMTTTPLLVTVGGLLAFGLVRALRLRGPLDAIFIALAGLAFCTNWVVLLYPKDLIRTVALPLALLPFVARSARVVKPS